MSIPLSQHSGGRANAQPHPSYARVAHILGIENYHANRNKYHPCLNYVLNRHIKTEIPLDAYLNLFEEVVIHCCANGATPPEKIKALIESMTTSTTHEYFEKTNTIAASDKRRKEVEDTILTMIGTWSMMLSSFRHLPIIGGRRVILAHEHRSPQALQGREALNETAPDLIKNSGLLPLKEVSLNSGGNDAIFQAATAFVQILSSTSNQSSGGAGPNYGTLGPPQDPTLMRSLYNMDFVEALEIDVHRLNAFTLHLLQSVQINWTQDVSRHLLLAKRGDQHFLDVFAIPCTLEPNNMTKKYKALLNELIPEIQETYSNLFHAWWSEPLHVRWCGSLGIRKICWCSFCSSYRYWMVVLYRHKEHNGYTVASKEQHDTRLSEFDPMLVFFRDKKPKNWSHENFPNLWSRITILDRHIEEAKPWSIWVLLRDRRDTLQYWTFM